MRLPTILHRILLIIAVAPMCGGQDSRMPPPAGMRLEVVSVRPMSTEESVRRSPSDVFGLDLVVRLRLSTAETGVYFLATKNPVNLIPEGHRVKLTEKGVVWRYGTISGG